MAGYGRISGKTTNHVTKTRAKSDADGYSAGIYGTYYANEADKSGLYVDSWVQYNWFKTGLTETNYRKKNIILTVSRFPPKPDTVSL